MEWFKLNELILKKNLSLNISNFVLLSLKKHCTIPSFVRHSYNIWAFSWTNNCCIDTIKLTEINDDSYLNVIDQYPIIVSSARELNKTWIFLQNQGEKYFIMMSQNTIDIYRTEMLYVGFKLDTFITKNVVYFNYNKELFVFK